MINVLYSRIGIKHSIHQRGHASVKFRSM